MTTPVLICDDSSFARKQMARALPQDWNVDVSFANNGAEGLEAIKAGKGAILFLDLNMPIMDGYQVLAAIREQDLQTLVIVVSGDIQPEAHQRVMNFGALDFIKKPTNAAIVNEILDKYGIRGEGKGDLSKLEVKVDIRECYQEIANVAMGRAADLLARVLDAFVMLPVPNANMLEASELQMALHQIADRENCYSVCQGFIGAGIAGEALLMFNESSFSDIAELMKFEGEYDESVRIELLMDIASILIGASLNGIADQLDITFSQGHPVVLGQHVKVEDLLKHNKTRWNQTLAIEIPYKIENRRISCELLLLITEDSIEPLNERLSYIMD